MKGIRFYEELENKNRKAEKSRGTVFAAFVCNGIHHDCYDGAGAVFDSPDSPACGCSASLDYLWEDCRRISEAKAREIHPALFEYLGE